MRAFFDREIAPHVPDAWINTAVREQKDRLVGKVGFEINFTRYFYKYAPPRSLEVRATSNFIRDGQDLNFENFRLVKLPRVFLREQQTVAVFLDRETARIDALLVKVREAIERLREYRTALISAAVTGKIDVRGESGRPD